MCLYLCAFLQNIHSATEEFRLAQLKEREEFIKVSSYDCLYTSVTAIHCLLQGAIVVHSTHTTPHVHTMCTHTDCAVRDPT